MYVLPNTELYLGKSKESNDQAIKIAKLKLNSFFVTKKDNKKVGRSCMEFSSMPDTTVHQVLCNINAPLFCCPLFFRKYLYPQGSTKRQVITNNYHSSPSGLTSRLDPLNFNRPLKVLSLYKNVFSFCESSYIFHHTWKKQTSENSQIYGVQIPRKCIFKSKN